MQNAQPYLFPRENVSSTGGYWKSALCPCVRRRSASGLPPPVLGAAGHGARGWPRPAGAGAGCRAKAAAGEEAVGLASGCRGRGRPPPHCKATSAGPQAGRERLPRKRGRGGHWPPRSRPVARVANCGARPLARAACRGTTRARVLPLGPHRRSGEPAAVAAGHWFRAAAQEAARGRLPQVRAQRPWAQAAGPPAVARASWGRRGSQETCRGRTGQQLGTHREEHRRVLLLAPVRPACFCSSMLLWRPILPLASSR